MKRKLPSQQIWENKNRNVLNYFTNDFYQVKATVICGLCFFIFSYNTTHAQSNDSLRSVIDSQVNQIVDKFYYNNFDSALIYLEPLSKQAKENGLWVQYLNILVDKARMAEEQRQIDSLQQYIIQGYQISQTYKKNLDTSDPNGYLRSYVSYLEGMLGYASGNFNQAIGAFERIAFNERRLTKPDSIELFYNYFNLGQSYLIIEDFENALLFYHQAKQWLPRNSADYGVVRDYNYQLAKTSAAIGNTFFKKGISYKSSLTYEKAKPYFFSALTVLEKKENSSGAVKLLSLTYQKIADYYIYVNQHDSAVYFVEKMGKILFGNDADDLENSLYIGRVYLKTNNFDKAIALFRESMVLAKKVYKGKHYKNAKVQYHLGQWHASQENWNEALVFYQKALAQLTDNYEAKGDIYDAKGPTGIIIDHELLQVLLLKAAALEAWYKTDVTKQKQLLAAMDNYRLAINLAEKMRQNFLLSESRQFLASKSHEIYENAIEVVYQAYQTGLGSQYVEEAFWLMEKNKSNLLLEAVKDASAKQFTGIPLDILEEETQIKSKVSYLKRALSKESDNDSEQANQLKNSLFEAQQAYQKFTMELEQSYPKYHRLKYDKQTISLKEVQQLIGKKTALVAYFYGDNNIYVIGITHDKTTFIRLPNNEELLLDFVDNIGNHEYAKANNYSRIEKFSKNGYALYQQLLAPVISQLNKDIDQLKIIPDGLLGYLPFDILLTEENKSASLSYKNLPYLINDFTITTEFSATLLKEKRIESANYEFQYVGFAPSYKGTLLAENYEGSRGVETPGMKFSPLKYNALEVATGHEIFDGKAFYGKEATELSFKEYAPKSKIIHLSTHAFANTKNAQFSGLAFVQPNGNTTVENDGLVYIDDLYNMRLNAELTVLSACETAVGEFKRGEGVMSLGRAFKYAGCQNIVMSSWTISDWSTENLMRYFYEELNDGKGKADALRLAKLRYLETADANTADPYYWAAFTLIGDNEPIVENGWKTSKLMWISMATVLLLFGFLFYRKKR